MFACLDDNFYDSPAFAEAVNECIGVWAKGLAYCNRHLTDGYIPERIARGFVERVPNATLEQTDSGALLAEMVKSGLWKRRDGGFLHVGYLDHNPSKANVLAMRESAKARKTKWKERMAGTRSERDPGTVPNPILSNPIQSNNILGSQGSPDALPTRVERRKGTRLADDWEPPSGADGDSWRDVARRKGFTPAQVSEAKDAFKDHWRAAGGQRGVKLDWNATWRNWLRNTRVDNRQVRNDRDYGRPVESKPFDWAAKERAEREERRRQKELEAKRAEAAGTLELNARRDVALAQLAKLGGE